MIKTPSTTRATSLVGVLGGKNRKPRGPTRDWNVRKKQWTELYDQNKDEEFSEMHINHTTFNILLNTLWDGLILTPTNFVPEPTSPDRQLPVSLYRLTHRLGRRFWDFKRIGMRIFQQVNSPYSCLLLRRIHEVAWDWQAVGSRSSWIFRKLGLFSCGAWDGFHIQVNSQLKANFSFKKSIRWTSWLYHHTTKDFCMQPLVH